MMTEPEILANMKRMAGAYRLRLARRAHQLGADPPMWDNRPISIDEEERSLLAEDKRRIEPYPFPGLRSFDTEEGEIFFGRKRNVEDVRKLLDHNRVVAVLGGSGSGKSSLLRAGLLPFLNTKQRIQGRVGNWYKAEFRPRTQPLHELASALAEQLMLPLLGLKPAILAQEIGFPSKIDVKSVDAGPWLREVFQRRLVNANRQGRTAVLDTFTDIAERQLDHWDNIVTGGRRLAAPSLFLLVDQLEEAFRPEVCADERDALLNLIVDLHSDGKARKSGVFLALTMRSEELHRCAEHRGLSEVVIGSGYQLELLDPADAEDSADLRLAIVQPARNVFADWGLGDWLKRKDEAANKNRKKKDAPFSPDMPDLLLNAAARLSKELEHRPDQLPLLQQALQATWHCAMKRWSHGVARLEELEIKPEDFPGYHSGEDILDLGECLNMRADAAREHAVERFAEIAAATRETGEEALQATFRALARRDDNGNWARRFAGHKDVAVFLDAEGNSSLARMDKDLRWTALQKALNSFLLRGYLNGDGTRDYDISHEALIRNWRRFQLWLRDPGEVAYCLGRVLQEVEEPEKFTSLSDREKINLIPQDVARRVAMVSAEGQLPTSWGEDQIEHLLQRSTIRARWGKSKQALEGVIRLSKMADQARQRVMQTRARAIRNRYLMYGCAALAVFCLIGLFYLYAEKVAADTVAANKVRNLVSVGYLALSSDGPATAILIAGQIQKDQPKLPETERLILRSLHDLRESRILTGQKLNVSGISYSPNGGVLVTADQGNLFFRRSNDGRLIDIMNSSYFEEGSPKFDGPFFGVQWSPARNWIAIASRDQTLLIAPCSRRELKRLFLNCSDTDSDMRQVLGSATERAGAAKFSADGKWMVTGSFGTSIKRWDLTETPVRKTLEFEATILMPNAFAISLDMQVVAAGTGPGLIKLLDATSGEALKSSPLSNGDRSIIAAIAFNPKDPQMLAASSTNGKIFVWRDWSNSNKDQSPVELRGTHGSAYQIAFSKDGSYLVGTSDDGVARMWLTRKLEAEPVKLVGHKSPIWAITTSMDGNQIASGSADGHVILWNRYSAFYRGQAPNRADDERSADSIEGETVADCSRGLQLSKGPPAFCIRSRHDRVVVAYSDGTIQEFDRNKDRETPIDTYPVNADVAGLAFDTDGLVVETRDGTREKLSFFDDLDKLMDYALSKLPFEGDQDNPLRLPNTLLCSIKYNEKDCDVASSVSEQEDLR